VEKGGFTAALADVGMTATSCVGAADEMRVGLRGTTRRVWGRRGVKVRQRLQFQYEWRYLVLVVDPRTGKLWWNWTRTMQADELVGLVRGLHERTEVEALVWDRAPSHRDGRVRRVGLPLIELPPYSPELNPAERLFEELRREVEGEVYATLDHKVAAIEAILHDLDAHPARVQQLCGWDWVHAAFADLPSYDQEIAA
jgi:transposase